MRLEPTTVTDKDGKISDAHVAKCDVCNGDVFNIFVVNGHNHIQCANPICGETFCQGECEQPENNAGCEKCGCNDRINNGSMFCEGCAADAKCSYCGSALLNDKGECQKCGL